MRASWKTAIKSCESVSSHLNQDLGKFQGLTGCDRQLDVVFL